MSAISVSDVGRLDKDHVGAGLDIGGGTVERSFKPLHRNRVGAGDDDEIGIVQGVAHGLELRHHLSGRHDALVVIVAAFLREGLVFQMEGGNARALEGARGGLRIERIAIAGVGIGDDRHIDDIHHRGESFDNVADRDQAEVRHPGGSGDGAAAGIDRRKSRLRHEPRRQAVKGAGRHSDAPGGKYLS